MSQGPNLENRWWIVFGATLSMLVAQGPVILYTLGLFIKPLNQDFGWDRASISAAGGIAAICSAIAIPFVGWLIDRWGIRPVLLPVIVLSAASIALIGLTPNSIGVFMLFMPSVLGLILGRPVAPGTWLLRLAPLLSALALIATFAMPFAVISDAGATAVLQIAHIDPYSLTILLCSVAFPLLALAGLVLSVGATGASRFVRVYAGLTSLALVVAGIYAASIGWLPAMTWTM